MKKRIYSSPIIYYNIDGVTIYAKYWYKGNRPHRLDGPAIIWYNEDGSIDEEYWYVDGELLTEEQVLAHKRNLVINKLLDQ